VIVLLSHSLNEQTPLYGGAKGISIEQKSRIGEESSSNTQVWHFPNHSGTHIDAPRHFIEEGSTLTDYPASFWVFERPQILDVPCTPGELITEEQVRDRIMDGTDLLLLRTGFEKHRGEALYWENNPGLGPGLGVFLREHHPSIRVVGLDAVSVSRWQDRPTGRIAHKAFLGYDTPGEPVLLIEDMKLAECPAVLSRVVVAPLLVDETDGGPVTVFAWGE
jgi:arylformamidase